MELNFEQPKDKEVEKTQGKETSEGHAYDREREAEEKHNPETPSS